MMDTFKTTVYNAIKTLSATVSLAGNNDFNELPAVTYMITNNVPNYDFQKEINLQDLEVTLDIYANSSTVASNLLKAAELNLRGIDLFLNYTADIPNADGIYHINARFVGLI